jgi:hypothetical protein
VIVVSARLTPPWMVNGVAGFTENTPFSCMLVLPMIARTVTGVPKSSVQAPGTGGSSGAGGATTGMETLRLRPVSACEVRLAILGMVYL